MDKLVRIGTRESKLALWQADQVQQFLDSLYYQTEKILIKSEGDIDLVTPLYESGVQGIFTKSLDIALLENRIDCAVHSLKDIPIQPAKGLVIAAIMQRGNPYDVLVCKNEKAADEVRNKKNLVIATSSIRRTAQWLYQYPGSRIENIRGNVNTRMEKVSTSGWHGAIFAAAGLDRLGLLDLDSNTQLLLDWMLPAPGQGAVAVVCRKDSPMIDLFTSMDHPDSRLCTTVEREFLHLLMGGCSTPIGGMATIYNDEIIFKGNITAVDGSSTSTVTIKSDRKNASSIATKAIEKIRSTAGIETLLN